MLTASQQKVYDYLRNRAQSGLPPTVREICRATGLKSTSSVHAHLKTLEREGYIVRDAGLNRAIHIAGELEKWCSEAHMLPVYRKCLARLKQPGFEG